MLVHSFPRDVHVIGDVYSYALTTRLNEQKCLQIYIEVRLSKSWRNQDSLREWLEHNEFQILLKENIKKQLEKFDKSKIEHDISNLEAQIKNPNYTRSPIIGPYLQYYSQTRSFANLVLNIFTNNIKFDDIFNHIDKTNIRMSL